jgi:uncharacterized membrane protein
LFVILFRIIHIGAAIAWAGGAVLFFFYLEPTMNKLGPDAEKFVDELINRRKLPQFFAIASTITVLGGLVLYYKDAGGLSIWTSTSGLVYTVGAIAGILAWLGGGIFLAPGIKKLGEIGGQIKAAGGPPSAELMSRLRAQQERVHTIGMWDLILIVVAIIAMESARYVG